MLGHATLNDDEPQAVRHYEEAAEAFRRMGEAEGEVIARQNLRILYHRRGAIEAAAEQVALAKEAAEKSNAPLAIVRASVLEAAHILDAGGDVGRAHRALLRAERFAFPAAPIALRRTILFNLANANLYLGRLDDAIDALERHRALRAEDGATTDAAPVAFGLLNAHVTQAEARPSAPARAKLVEMAERVVAEIQRLNRPAPRRRRIACSAICCGRRIATERRRIYAAAWRSKRRWGTRRFARRASGRSPCTRCRRIRCRQSS